MTMSPDIRIVKNARKLLHDDPLVFCQIVLMYLEYFEPDDIMDVKMRDTEGRLVSYKTNHDTFERERVVEAPKVRDSLDVNNTNTEGM